MAFLRPSPARSRSFFIRVFQKSLADRIFLRAASLAYLTLLTVVPIVAIAFSILQRFHVSKAYLLDVQNYILANFLPHIGSKLGDLLNTTITQAQHLPLLSIFILIVSVFLMILSLEHHVNDIWQLKYQRKITKTVLIYWFIILLGPILLAVGLIFSSYLASISWLQHINLQVHDYAWFLAPEIYVFIGFCILFYVLPHTKVSVLSALLASLVSSVLFWVAKLGFELYVVHFPTYRLLYGTLAIIPLFLIWVYVLWLIFFMGVELVYALCKSKEVKAS